MSFETLMFLTAVTLIVIAIYLAVRKELGK